MSSKTLAVLLMIAAPFIMFGIVYLFGWVLTLFVMLFGVSLSSARTMGVAISIVIAIMFINYQSHK
ncbi:hypothetical protein BMG01_06995 [Leuconostoc sp. BM2]|nr:hypothetical protein BMS80_08465 [Leuconostoc pseudomesenteroides]ORI51208.1 hypothetical protein BMS85_08135 [Leuconostoc pseudomesenteroides]ORI57837.1 hypothetical protein BMS88_08220 [Leuconostoc pseudomesenteroides]ORI73761.1 hypothetical protein BMS65_06995 [Leuconostoc pseudomesenteroides]ORM43021.1 hypothetical protein BMG01_06995 [Leuconostoc sp. BM2]